MKSDENGDAPWTAAQVKLLHDREIQGLKDLLNERDGNYKEAILVAKDATDAQEKRLAEDRTKSDAKQNEWRGTVTDFREKTVTREEHKADIKNVADKIDRNTEDIRRIDNRLAGGAGGEIAIDRRRTQSNWLIAILVTVGLAMIGFFLTAAGLAFVLLGKQ